MNTSLTNLLLHETCAERSDAIVVELGQKAAVRVPKSIDVVAHLVIDGEVEIHIEQMETPIVLRRGEYGLLLYGNEHRIQVAGADSAMECHTIKEWPRGEEPATLKVGTGASVAKLISAALRTVYSPVSVQFLHPLPELQHLLHDRPTTLSGAALLTNMDQIAHACHGPGGNAFVNALMNLHLFQALRHGSEQLGNAMPLVNPTNLSHSPTFRPVAVALRMLRMHPERHWTVAELARELGLSRSSFAAHFRTIVGVGPMEYLTNVRMEKAAELLRIRRDMALSAISRRVGYDNNSSFVRAFKAHFGVPPKAFSSQSGPYAASPVSPSPAIASEHSTPKTPKS